MRKEPYDSILELCEQPIMAHELTKKLNIRGSALTNYLTVMKKEGKLIVVGKKRHNYNFRFLWQKNPDYVAIPPRRPSSQKDKEAIIHQLKKCKGEMTAKELSEALSMNVLRVSRFICELSKLNVVRSRMQELGKNRNIYHYSIYKPHDEERSKELAQQQVLKEDNERWWLGLHQRIEHRKNRKQHPC